MSKWLLALAMLAGCQTTHQAVETPKFADGACVTWSESRDDGEEDAQFKGQVLDHTKTKYLVLVGVLNSPMGPVLITEKMYIDSADKLFKACEE